MLARQKQAFTRCVRHGNLMNKRGVAAQFQNSIHNQRLPVHTRKYHVAPTCDPPSRHFGDLVVRPPAPKHLMPEVCETRFTLPNTHVNSNIYEQVMIRSHDSFEDVMHELKSYHKIHAFNVDQDHEIEIIMC